MSITKEQIVETISGMSVMDVMELVSAMEEKFGVTAAAAVPAQVAGVAAGSVEAEQEEEKTSFDVLLSAVGDKKINVIKAVRSVTTLGLKEAKELVEKAPVTIKGDILKDEAENMKSKLEEAGATVEIK